MRFSLLFLGLLATPVMALQISVASNFAPALEKLLPQFEQQTGIDVRVTIGSSGMLAAQIRQGAPVDVFMSADVARPRNLELLGLTLRHSRQTYAYGSLVLLGADPKQPLAEQLGRARTVALANPALAPYGRAAQNVLQKLQLEPEHKVLAANVAQAYQYVASGNATMGFVSRAQITNPALSDYHILPSKWYQPIEQQLVILKSTQRRLQAQSWVNYITSDDVQRHLTTLGYEASAP